MKKKNRFLASIKYFIILGLAGAGLFWWNAAVEKKEAILTATEIIPTPVSVTLPLYGNLEKIFTISGFIESETMITVLPMVSGLLTELIPDVGTSVNKGDYIGQIDNEPYLLQAQQAETAYLAAKSTYERMDALYQAGATSQQNYSQSRSQYEAYKSQYDLAMLQLNYTKLEAPVDGIVLVRHINEGSLAAPQTPVITIGDLDKLVVRAKIPEQYYEVFAQNTNSMKITIKRPGESGTVYSATIKNISPFISAESRNFEVSCQIEGNIELLRPGMFVSCSFEVDNMQNVYYLPFSALSSTDMMWYVNEENKTAHKMVAREIFHNDDFFVIDEEYGQRKFIIEGQFFIIDGQTVNPVSREEL